MTRADLQTPDLAPPHPQLPDLWLIGMGTGSPGHLTQEARTALQEAALILIPQKGAGKEDLADLRYALLSSLGVSQNITPFEMPVRDPSLPYNARVDQWHDEIARRWQASIAKAAPKGPVALLVWGDPGLYDSTLRIAARLSPAPNLRVMPGITALQALTAAHAIPFNTINGAVTITTGRRLRDAGWPPGCETLAVMLDGECSFQKLPQPEKYYIWWGGFLGMENQILAHGPLDIVAPQIIATRAKARAQHGWIMDSYLLRRINVDDQT